MTQPKRNAPRTKIQYRELFKMLSGCLVGLLVVIAIGAGALYGIPWLLQPIDLAPQPSKLQVPYRPEREEKVVSPNVYARVLNGASSDESFYLDGSYTPRITVVDSEENCVLSLFAREAGDGYGTAIFNDLVIGNAGSFPGPYRQTFTWDSVSFSGETVRFYNDGGCDEVQLFMNRE